MIPIVGFNKTTLLDYPKHLAATIFLLGCNFRCPYCHNASIITYNTCTPLINQSAVLDELSKRKPFLEGVCVTGGEPTIHLDLPQFLKELKSMGYLVKLDTNGTNPSMLEQLLSLHVIDYVAMDIKHSKEHYLSAVGINTFDFSLIEQSISLLLHSNIDYEFRTTVVKELHHPEDLVSIGKMIYGAKLYYLQNFKDNSDVPNHSLTPCSDKELNELRKAVLPYVPTSYIRGEQ